MAPVALNGSCELSDQEAREGASEAVDVVAPRHDPCLGQSFGSVSGPTNVVQVQQAPSSYIAPTQGVPPHPSQVNSPCCLPMLTFRIEQTTTDLAGVLPLRVELRPEVVATDRLHTVVALDPSQDVVAERDLLRVRVEMV